MKKLSTTQVESIKKRLLSSFSKKGVTSILLEVMRLPDFSLLGKYKFITTFFILKEYILKYDAVNEDSFFVYLQNGYPSSWYIFSPKHGNLNIFSTPINSLRMPSGELFVSYIRKITGDDVFDDKNVGLYGGIPRLALKLLAKEQGKITGFFAEELISSELPVNDVDIMVNMYSFTGLSKFNETPSWAIIVNNIEEEIQSILQTRDCSLNQVLIYNSKLYYTQKALNDVSVGVIDFISRDRGDAVCILKSGKKYIKKEGLYRALGYILRGKAKKFLIYKENLLLEVPRMEEYWIILLIKKIVTMEDQTKRVTAIENWFNCAKNIGATKAKCPKDFLQELLLKFPTAKKNILQEEIPSCYNFEVEPQQFIKKCISRLVDMSVHLEGEVYIQDMSDEQITIDEKFLQGPHHNTQELLYFLAELKNNP